MTEPGLCSTCRHARAIRTQRSVFWMCERSRDEPTRFARYPRLPVVACSGFERAPGA